MKSELNTIFCKSVGLWWQNLSLLVSEIVSRGKKPVFVAISRKMPRLINWIIEISGDNLIKDHLLITELALPFIYFHEEADDLEFVILDDLIVHGTTLRTVYENIYALFGCKAHVSCIFRHTRANIGDFVDKADMSKILMLSQEQVDDISELIADIVSESQLPIDMEFPIFSVDCPLYEVVNSLKQKDSTACFYTHGHKSFTYNLAEANAVGDNVDFCKIRFFEKSDKTVFEVFSPLTIAECDLLSTDTSPFGDSVYTAVWERLTRGLRICLNPQYGKSAFLSSISLVESSIRSLVVIANYLYSISALSLNADAIFNTNFQKLAVLSLQDLALLIGKESADDIYPVLQTVLIIGNTTLTHKGKYLNVPESFAPMNFRAEMDALKLTAAIFSQTPAEAFDRIFNYQHYTNPKFDNPYIAYERLFFGETHNSLADTVSIFSDSELIEQETQKWVDENIDAGFIIPKYERVESADGGYYWRRFFHAGIRRKNQATAEGNH